MLVGSMSGHLLHLHFHRLYGVRTKHGNVLALPTTSGVFVACDSRSTHVHQSYSWNLRRRLLILPCTLLHFCAIMNDQTAAGRNNDDPKHQADEFMMDGIVNTTGCQAKKFCNHQDITSQLVCCRGFTIINQSVRRILNQDYFSKLPQ